ncbi:MAG TPA: BsuPI-related putative proteinase inhibitor [Abditibacteriaceae bacterium]|jgi:hypothetical protein
MKKLFPLALLVCVAGCRVKGDLPPGVGASPRPLPPPVVVAPVEENGTAPTDTTPTGTVRPEETDNSKSSAGLKFTVAANRTAMRRGDTVLFTMTLRNEGKEEAKLVFNSGQDFDIRARRVGSQETAWSWSMNKMFTEALRNVSLAPTRSLVYTATWDGTAGGTRLPRGEYEIVAFTASRPQIESAPIKISID